MSDADRIADRLEASGKMNEARAAMQLLLTRQFLYETDVRSQKAYRFIRENWRDIEPLIDIMGFRPYRDFEAGVIGILLLPIYDKDGQTIPPPMERRISLQETRLLLVLRQLYHIGMTSTHSGDEPGVAITTTVDIMAALAGNNPDRQYRSHSALIEDLKTFEKNGIVALGKTLPEGGMVVELRQALPAIFENDGYVDLLEAFASRSRRGTDAEVPKIMEEGA